MPAPPNPLPPTSVWTLMSYIPPRGRCNFKASLMTPACPCLRYMLHPVKAATSFECDGCGHHASFHSMENKEEEGVVRRWAEEEKAKRREGEDAGVDAGAAGGGREVGGRKRKRIAGKGGGEEGRVIELSDGGEVEEQIFEELVGARRKKGKKG